MRTLKVLVRPVAGVALLSCVLPFSMNAMASTAQPVDAGAASVATSPDPAAQVPDSTMVLEQIVVTARRRTENAQDVPMAIAAFAPETLQQQDIRTVTDLERAIPGLNLCCGRGRVDYVWLRGIPGVVGYFSEVPVNLNGSALFFDLGGVSALKGPQGTLFGLSTNGGAILYAPARPTESLEGYAQSILGNYGRQTTEGVINLPFMDGKLLVRAGVQVSHTDGYMRDLAQNKILNDENYRVGRLSVTARPIDSFENTFVLNYYTSHDNGTASIITDVNPNGYAALIYGLGTVTADLERQRELGFYTVESHAVPGGTFSKREQLNFVDTAAWQIADGLTLKNIYGYQRTDDSGRNAVVTAPRPVLDYYGSHSGATTLHTEELQLQGEALARLTYTLGTFHSWRDQDPKRGYYSFLGAISGSTATTTARTQAVYAQGTYDLSEVLDGLSVTAGYRYSWDKRTLNSAALNEAGSVLSEFSGSGDWSAPGYTLSLQYSVNAQTMLFLTNSKGYSSGGFNTDNYTPAQFQTFGPESLNNFEAGIKSDWQLGSVQGRTNLTGFYGDYSDIQTYLVVPPASNAPPSVQSVIVQLNAAKGHIYGVDVQSTLILFDALELSGSVTVVKSGYDEYMSGGEDLSDREFVFIPDLKYSLRADYSLPIDAFYGELSLSADYSRQTKINANANKKVPIPQDYFAGFDNLNLGLNWSNVAGNPALSGSLFMTNVANNRFGAGGATGYDTTGYKNYEVVAPRMWGVRARYDF